MTVKLPVEFRCGTLPACFSSRGTLFLIGIVLKPSILGSLGPRSALSPNCRARMCFVLFLLNAGLSCSGKRKALSVSGNLEKEELGAVSLLSPTAAPILSNHLSPE